VRALVLLQERVHGSDARSDQLGDYLSRTRSESLAIRFQFKLGSNQRKVTVGGGSHGADRAAPALMDHRYAVFG
jgi:hypothetical protein